jgi:hypothetical protein
MQIISSWIYLNNILKIDKALSLKEEYFIYFAFLKNAYKLGREPYLLTSC